MEKVKYIPGDLVILDVNPDEVVRVILVSSPASTWKNNENSYSLERPNGDIFSSKEHYLLGILLSPEILMQNGFAKQIGAETTSYYNEKYRLKLGHFNSQKYINYRVYYENKCTSLEIRFVHQLQHLLFGLGLDSSLKV